MLNFLLICFFVEIIDRLNDIYSCRTYSVGQVSSDNPPVSPNKRPTFHRRPTHPPVRIDTCIVGDDSTCDKAQNERCRTEVGVSSCHCRPGYSRRKHREPCIRKFNYCNIVSCLDKCYFHIYIATSLINEFVWQKCLSEVFSFPILSSPLPSYL